VEKSDQGGDSEATSPRLPRGRHGLPRKVVVENQRGRLISGVIEVVAERGYGAATVTQITEAAKLSRRTFYQQFSNKEDCFVAAYEASIAYLRKATLTAAANQETWPERVRAGLAGLLDALAQGPAIARFVLIAPASAGDEIAARHHLAMGELLSTLIVGPPGPPGPIKPSSTREQALGGGLSRLIVRELNAGEDEKLEELLPDLVELVLRPFVGNEEAVRVARKAE
jgi:AcrR family transcriptional regulator